MISRVFGDRVSFFYRGAWHDGTVMGQLGKDYVYVLVPDLRLVVTVHPDRISANGAFEDWEERLALSQVLQRPLPSHIWTQDDHLAEQKMEILKLIKTRKLIDETLFQLGKI